MKKRIPLCRPIFFALMILVTGCASGTGQPVQETQAAASTAAPEGSEQAVAESRKKAEAGAGENADAKKHENTDAEFLNKPEPADDREEEADTGGNEDQDAPAGETEEDQQCDDDEDPSYDRENTLIDDDRDVFQSEDEDDSESREKEEQADSHTHVWEEQTQVIHHEETGHFEKTETGTRTIVDEEAWDEPVCESRPVCSACGYEAESVEEMNDHLDSHYDPELGYIDAGYSVEEIVVGTIHHPEKTHEEPVYEERWVVDSEAWDEEVVKGYRCSICGEEK